jgi:hypothetical protein
VKCRTCFSTALRVLSLIKRVSLRKPSCFTAWLRSSQGEGRPPAGRKAFWEMASHEGRFRRNLLDLGPEMSNIWPTYVFGSPCAL